MRFILEHRATTLGTAWALVGPLSFIAFLGYVYSHVNTTPFDVYLLYLTVGLISWNLISGFLNAASSVFIRNRPFLLQAELSITDVVVQETIQLMVIFCYQFLLIVGALLIARPELNASVFSSLLALFVIIYTGFMTTIVVGIVGTRFRDGAYVIPAAVRILFLATPIIWVADKFSARSAVVAAYIQFNPFYHYIEVVRRPLTDGTVPVNSWIVVIAISCFVTVLATVTHRRFSKVLPLWL